MFKNFNPIWIPFLTFWIPALIARQPIPNESLKTALIWMVIIVQVYFLYKGINYLKYNRKDD